MEKVTIGNAELYCGDCAVILPQLEPVDLILTDPPYGIGADKNTRANKKHGNAIAPSKDYGVGNWDSAPPPVWLFGLMQDKSKHQIIFGGNYFVLPPTRCVLVWDKETGDNGYADAELAWTNLDKAVRLKKWLWKGMMQEQKEERQHPTQKPTRIMEWCITQAPADVVTICDPFMGSGTTGVAAMNLEKRFIGIERERKYFDIACERIQAAQAQGRLAI